jgi:hypothetical protein
LIGKIDPRVVHRAGTIELETTTKYCGINIWVLDEVDYSSEDFRETESLDFDFLMETVYDENSPEVETNPQVRALLLGMVYAKEAKPARGQSYRDMIRCIALESLGYIVDTLDDKHESATGKEGKQRDITPHSP